MAEKSGFFNALLIDNIHDRKYNANDYSDNLAIVIGNGVRRSTDDDLRCTANGMRATVNPGRAWINGHYYFNDTQYTFEPTPAPVGGKRIDRVVLRLDNRLTARKISLEYIHGTEAATPQRPAPTRNADVYDLVLADVYVEPNTASINVTDTRADANVCGWVYSTAGDNSFFTSLDSAFNDWFKETKNTLASVTLFKRYTWEKTLTVTTSRVAFSIPQYDPETCFLEVYVNGLLEKGFTISGNILTFDGTLTAGTAVLVNCFKSIDGTGITSAAEEITQLQNQIATIQGTNKFVYTCIGLDDNIALSEIAQALNNGTYTPGDVSEPAELFLEALGGNTYLAQLPPEAQVEIDVVGKLGATTPAAGSGTATSRYIWFKFGVDAPREKKIIFNFSKCQKITIACAGNTNNIIFYGTDQNMKNANVYAYSNGTNCIITMLGGAYDGRINCNDCRFSISTSGHATIAENGNFTNCFCTVKTTGGNALCFNAKGASLIRLIGGTYYAYTGSSANDTAILYIGAGESHAAILAENINAPTIAEAGFIQRNLAKASAGGIYVNGVVSTMTSDGTAATVTGQIWKSKR